VLDGDTVVGALVVGKTLGENEAVVAVPVEDEDGEVIGLRRGELAVAWVVLTRALEALAPTPLVAVGAHVALADTALAEGSRDEAREHLDAVSRLLATAGVEGDGQWAPLLNELRAARLSARPTGVAADASSRQAGGRWGRMGCPLRSPSASSKELRREAAERRRRRRHRTSVSACYVRAVLWGSRCGG
jgi:hypothetical protein